MSDKALITDAELELSQRIQRQLPRGVNPKIIAELNGQPKEVFDTNLLRFLQNRGQMQVVTTNGIIAPPSGIVIPFTIPVNESRDWNEAIKAASPNTDRSGGIWKVGDQYPAMAGAVERLEQIWLVNFGKGRRTSSQSAIEWGKEQHLVPDSPRANFAIAEHLPKLNTYLGMDHMVVASLRKCSFGGGDHVVRVWFAGSGRGASLSWFGSDWHDSDWFVFARDLEPGDLGS